MVFPGPNCFPARSVTTTTLAEGVAEDRSGPLSQPLQLGIEPWPLRPSERIGLTSEGFASRLAPRLVEQLHEVLLQQLHLAPRTECELVLVAPVPTFAKEECQTTATTSGAMNSYCKTTCT